MARSMRLMREATMLNWIKQLFESDEQRVGRWLVNEGADDSAAKHLVFLHRYHCIELSEMGIEVYRKKVRWSFISPVDHEMISGEYSGGKAR